MKREFEKEVEAFKTQPEAKIIQLETKQPVSKKGIEQLIENAGQVSPPGTLAGDIETRVNRLKAIADKKGMNVGEILKKTGEAQLKYAAGNDVGLLRSVARQIMFNDIKSGKLKAPKEIQDIVSGASNIDVIEPFRNIYGENALEQLDSLIPDFKNVATEIDAEKLARSKYEFTPKLDRPKESYTADEMEKILKGEEPPEKKAKGGAIGLDYLTGQEPPKNGYAGGGRIGYAEGTPMAGLVYVGSWEGPWTGPEFLGGPRKGQYYNSSKNSLTAITGPDGAIPRPGMPITTIQSPQQSETISTSEIPLTVQERYKKYLSAAGSETGDELYKSYRANLDKKADGGRIGFASGKSKAVLDLIAKANKKLKGKKSMESVNPKTGEVTVPKEPVKPAEGMTVMDQEPITEADMIREKYGNLIDDNLLKQILVDDNPQRKAEVLATIDEAINMQQKGIAPEEIINIMKKTTRTKQAKGGSAGLDYLMGF